MHLTHRITQRIIKFDTTLDVGCMVGTRGNVRSRESPVNFDGFLRTNGCIYNKFSHCKRYYMLISSVS